ncbi:MAG: gamma-glutamylcyclotransferase family protein [Opitutales bacterium]
MREYPTHLFVYGTLMVPEVLRRLLGSTLRMEGAQLEGYSRFRVKGAVYPGIVSAGAKDIVSGAVLSGMTTAQWKTLDAYEGDEYERLMVEARLLSGQTMEAATYVYRDPLNLTDEPWDDSQVLETLGELGLGE